MGLGGSPVVKAAALAAVSARSLPGIPLCQPLTKCRESSYGYLADSSVLHTSSSSCRNLWPVRLSGISVFGSGGG